jgi:putative endonuclease
MDDADKSHIGARGEDAALTYLKTHGLKLIARNYRCRMGEIDLVMLDRKTLVLVEVRYRSSDAYGGAAASVTWHKQRRLVNAARHLLLSRSDLQRYPARFDVIAVSPGPRIEWLRNAFECRGG